MCSVFTYCVHAVLEKVNTDRSRWWVLPPVRQLEETELQNNPCPAQSPNRPNGRACCPFPRFHSATPTPAPGTCKSANRAHHFPSGSKTQIWRQVPQAAARALPRAVAATGLGPGTLQTIESQVHFRKRRLVPVSLNRQHETPTAEHLGFCFSQGPPCLGLLSLMELRFFGKAMVRIEGQNGRRLPEDPVQATASLSSALASSL